MPNKIKNYVGYILARENNFSIEQAMFLDEHDLLSFTKEELDQMVKDADQILDNGLSFQQRKEKLEEINPTVFDKEQYINKVTKYLKWSKWMNKNLDIDSSIDAYFTSKGIKIDQNKINNIKEASNTYYDYKDQPISAVSDIFDGVPLTVDQFMTKLLESNKKKYHSMKALFNSPEGLHSLEGDYINLLKNENIDNQIAFYEAMEIIAVDAEKYKTMMKNYANLSIEVSSLLANLNKELAKGQIVDDEVNLRKQGILGDRKIVLKSAIDMHSKKGKKITDDTVIQEYQRRYYNYFNSGSDFKLSPEGKTEKTELENFRKAFKSLNMDYKDIQIHDRTQDGLVASHNKDCETYYNTRKGYESKNIVARFFSHFLPNAWTKLGRTRNEMDRMENQFAEYNLDPEYVMKQVYRSKLRTSDSIPVQSPVQTGANESIDESTNEKAIIHEQVNLQPDGMNSTKITTNNNNAGSVNSAEIRYGGVSNDTYNNRFGAVSSDTYDK